MNIANPPKPTMYGCYLKYGRSEERTFTCHELSNGQEEAAGVTYIKIGGRLPQNDFVRNVQASYTCIVAGGSGTLLYFSDNTTKQYPIAIGDYIHIPQNAVYAFIAAGKPLEIILVGTPQWEWDMKGVIEPVTID